MLCHNNVLTLWVAQGSLSWLCWNQPVFFQLQSIWLESLKNLLIKSACIICSTLYVVIGFLQFVSSHLFKLYLVYVLTVANISMSQILFAKESQILFAKDFSDTFTLYLFSFQSFYCKISKIHFNSWHKFGNWQRIFTFAFAILLFPILLV